MLKISIWSLKHQNGSPKTSSLDTKMIKSEMCWCFKHHIKTFMKLTPGHRITFSLSHSFFFSMFARNEDVKIKIPINVFAKLLALFSCKLKVRLCFGKNVNSQILNHL